MKIIIGEDIYFPTKIHKRLGVQDEKIVNGVKFVAIQIQQSSEAKVVWIPETVWADIKYGTRTVYDLTGFAMGGV